MQYKKLASVGLLAVLMVSLALPLTFAAPTLALTPNIGPSGTFVVIAGSAFAPNKFYRVFFDTDGDSVRDYHEPMVSVKASAIGTFSASLIVPLVPSGEYCIRADDYPYTSPAVASASFTVRSLFEKLIDVRFVVLSAIASAREAILDGVADILLAIDSAKGVVLGAISELGEELNEKLGDIKEDVADVKGEMLVVTDHALFDTTGGDEGAKASSDKTFEFYLVATAYDGPATIRVTFNDGDWIEFHLKEHGDWISFTQAAGGSEGVDDILTITVESGNAVGWISIRTQKDAEPISPMTNFCETI